MTPSLTPRQREVLLYVSVRLDLHEMAPTYREIGEYLEMSQVTAFNHGKELLRKGYLRDCGAGSRSLRLTKRGRQVASGSPVERLDGFWEQLTGEEQEEWLERE